MRANELILKDWVKCGSDFEQVDYLENGNINGHPENWYEPIPLTAEILEKNGLRKITLDGEKGSKQDYYIDTNFVGYYNMNDLARVHASSIVYDIKQKWLFVDDNQTCRIDLMCPYVHTLQHALRLCGIDKEIVL